MELNVPLLQLNFLDDHRKLIISQDPSMSRDEDDYLVTFIDGERHVSTYWLSDLRDRGCSQELHERLLYVYKVVRDYAEQDLAN